MGDMANWYLDNALEEQFNREIASDNLLDEYKKNKLVQWKTKDGRFISVKDMTVTHVTNTINMLKRAESEDPIVETWIMIFELELKKRIKQT